MHLLQETGVATVAGSAFYHGDGGENLIRFCFAKTDAELAEACRRLKALPSVLNPDAELGREYTRINTNQLEKSKNRDSRCLSR